MRSWANQGVVGVSTQMLSALTSSRLVWIIGYYWGWGYIIVKKDAAIACGIFREGQRSKAKGKKPFSLRHATAADHEERGGCADKERCTWFRNNCAGRNHR